MAELEKNCDQACQSLIENEYWKWNELDCPHNKTCLKCFHPLDQNGFGCSHCHRSYHYSCIESPEASGARQACPLCRWRAWDVYPPNRQTPNSNSDDTRMQQAQRCVLLKDRSKEFKGQRIFYDDGSFESDFLLLANLQDRSVDVGSLGGALDENCTAVNVYKCQQRCIELETQLVELTHDRLQPSSERQQPPRTASDLKETTDEATWNNTEMLREDQSQDGERNDDLSAKIDSPEEEIENRWPEADASDLAVNLLNARYSLAKRVTDPRRLIENSGIRQNLIRKTMDLEVFKKWKPPPPKKPTKQSKTFKAEKANLASSMESRLDGQHKHTARGSRKGQRRDRQAFLDQVISSQSTDSTLPAADNYDREDPDADEDEPPAKIRRTAREDTTTSSTSNLIPAKHNSVSGDIFRARRFDISPPSDVNLSSRSSVADETSDYGLGDL